jgi:Transglycosylase SLT domain
MAGRGTCAIGLLAAAGALVSASATGAKTVRTETPLQRDARVLAETTGDLQRAIERWRRKGNPAVGRPPAPVLRAARRQQRLVIRLTANPGRAHAVVSRMQGRARRHVESAVRARLVLLRMGLPTPRPLRSFRVGTPLPAGVLLKHYREAHRRFGVGWHVLAAVNFVESGFGRIRTPSSAGALGPMQFMPATWKAYGFGGDVFKARDAILGAANYLRASGAPRDYWGALYHYNHSGLYVESVLRYAALMKRDPSAFYALYSWQVFVRTPAGLRPLAEPPPPVDCCDRVMPHPRKQPAQPVPAVTVVLPAPVPDRPIPVERATASSNSPEVRVRAGVQSLQAGPAVPVRSDRAWTPLQGRPQCCSRRAAQARTRQARAPPDDAGSATLPSVRRAGMQSAAGPVLSPRPTLRPEVLATAG